MNSNNIFSTGISITCLTAINYIKNYNIPKPNLISKELAQKKINENYFDYIFDVRDKEEYDKSKIINALNFYLPHINKKSLEKYDFDKKYLLYCNCGYRAKRGAEIMKANNFKNVYFIK